MLVNNGTWIGTWWFLLWKCAKEASIRTNVFIINAQYTALLGCMELLISCCLNEGWFKL